MILEKSVLNDVYWYSMSPGGRISTILRPPYIDAQAHKPLRLFAPGSLSCKSFQAHCKYNEPHILMRYDSTVLAYHAHSLDPSYLITFAD